MKRYLKLFARCYVVTFRANTMYKSAFIAGIIGQWLSYGATYATLYFLTTRFSNLDSWTPSEVLLLYGLSILSYSIAATFFFNPSTNLSGKIRTGEFDSVLTKPLNPFWHEVILGINTGYISHITLSVAVIIFALINSRFVFTVANIINLLFVIIGSTLIQSASLIASSVLSFFILNENPLLDFLVFNFKEFINYPITIYPRIIQVLLTFIIPFAYINYYPASFLLGKDIPDGFPFILRYLTFFVGILCFLLSIVLWNWGLKHYKSTGS
jgi:ABC-2 type transport system permease protein